VIKRLAVCQASLPGLARIGMAATGGQQQPKGLFYERPDWQDSIVGRRVLSHCR